MWHGGGFIVELLTGAIGGGEGGERGEGGETSLCSWLVASSS